MGFSGSARSYRHTPEISIDCVKPDRYGLKKGVWPANWVEPRPSTKQGVANHFGLSHTHEKNQNKNTSKNSHYKIKTNDGNFLDIDCVKSDRCGLKKGVWLTIYG